MTPLMTPLMTDGFDGPLLAQCTIELELNRAPRLWSPEAPALYGVVATLLSHGESRREGLQRSEVPPLPDGPLMTLASLMTP